MFPWSIILNPRVIGAIAGVLAVIGLLFGVYHMGVTTERAKWEKKELEAQIAATNQAREIEQQKNAEVQKVSEDYEAKIGSVHRNYGTWVSTLQLRVKKCGNANLSQAFGAAGGSNAAAPGTFGRGAGEANLDGTARRIAELGQDLDCCYVKVRSLQDLIRSYSEIK